MECYRCGEVLDLVVATTSLLVGVLEVAWSAIRDRHPQVPEVVVVVAAGSDGPTMEKGLGH